MTNPLPAYISCPKGIETLLADELDTIGGLQLLKQRVGGLETTAASLVDLYRVCLWSRLANRVLLQLDSAAITNKDELREWVLQQPWSTHLSAAQSFHIRLFGRIPGIQHSQYGAQFVKDAIVDYFRSATGQRPSVSKDQPDLRFQFNLGKHQSHLYLDLSGASLHQRGYRRSITAAPLKENLAAALLLRAKWDRIAATGGALIDPLCGSGTLLSEAALIAANIAPGLLRDKFGFSHWLQHDQPAWQQELQNARAQRQTPIPPILGYDSDKRALGVAEQHIAALNLGADAPRVYHKSIAEWKKPNHIALNPGLLICNPPYGERLGKDDDLFPLYNLLGRRWQDQCPNWQAAILSSDESLVKATRLYWDKNYKLYNGSLECRLYLFDLNKGCKPKTNSASAALKKLKKVDTAHIDIEPFKRRLLKNQQRLKGWLKQQDIECYRLYYADIPEFAVAIDRYQDWLLVQEFAAPKNIDTDKVQQRLAAIIQCLPDALNVPEQQIILKQRARQKGKSQYERFDTQSEWLQVNEGSVKLWVDMLGYLDTGLFLDHRPLRLKFANICKDKRFLNLFCYTAAATVHAATAAHSSASVDLSNTYLDWAQRNFALNDLDTNKHTLIRADVTRWLQQHRQQYDVIFLDPPTFSNSKSMQTTFDVQRDHAGLIQNAMRCLAKNGTLYFSTNFQKFRFAKKISESYKVRDISDWSIPRDFVRPGKIHYCYEISYKCRKNEP